MNIFLATPISMSMADSQLRADVLDQAFRDSTIELAQHVFNSVFQEKGGWDGFIDYVSTGVHFVTRHPAFDLICCVTPEVGHATAMIVKKSLRINKQVIFMTLDEDTVFLHQVQSIEEQDGDNWQVGWHLSYAAPFLQWRSDDHRIKHRA